MMVYGGVGIKRHAFLSLLLDWSESSVSEPVSKI
jgi:hypothetical protein